MNATDFIVIRNDLQQCKVIETRLPDAAALPAEPTNIIPVINTAPSVKAARRASSSVGSTSRSIVPASASIAAHTTKT